MMKVGLSLLLLLISARQLPAQERKSDFWNKQRRGTNYFNERPTTDWLVSAKELGISLVRLAPNKWKTERRDLLIGNADDFQGLVEEDFGKIKEVLDLAHSLGIKIVLTTLSLPGARWSQHNQNKDDRRIWRDARFQHQASLLWRELAARLKGHPALVGYNILNEPHPERVANIDDLGSPDAVEWYRRAAGTPADLNRFYALVVETIRQVDQETPIIVESGFYASPQAFEFLKALPDEKVIYSFHMYEPYSYTNNRLNVGRYRYPGKIPITNRLSGRQDATDWNLAAVSEYLRPVTVWQERYGIPSSRIFVGEFGCHRRVRGAAHYLEDLIKIFNGHKWHWAFYAFREDSWDGMDYELGTGPLPADFWKKKQRGEEPELHRSSNPLFEVLRREFAP